jgi:hypothetical protein
MNTIKKHRKPLSLRSETLRTLQNDEIVNVVGGQNHASLPSFLPTSCRTCTPTCPPTCRQSCYCG